MKNVKLMLLYLSTVAIFAMGLLSGGMAVFLVYRAIEVPVDMIQAFFIGLMCAFTGLCFYLGKMSLQTLPGHAKTTSKAKKTKKSKSSPKPPKPTPNRPVQQ